MKAIRTAYMQDSLAPPFTGEGASEVMDLIAEELCNPAPWRDALADVADTRLHSDDLDAIEEATKRRRNTGEPGEPLLETKQVEERLAAYGAFLKHFPEFDSDSVERPSTRETRDAGPMPD